MSTLDDQEHVLNNVINKRTDAHVIRINAGTFFFWENSPLPLKFGAALNDRIDKLHLKTDELIKVLL